MDSEEILPRTYQGAEKNKKVQSAPELAKGRLRPPPVFDAGQLGRDTGENTGDSGQQTEVIERTGMVRETPCTRWFRGLQMQPQSSVEIGFPPTYKQEVAGSSPALPTI